MSEINSRVNLKSESRSEAGNLTRRTVLGGVAVGSVAGVVAMSSPTFGIDSVTGPAASRMIQMDCESWKEFIGRTFTITGGGNDPGATLRLEEVIDDDWIGRLETARPAHVRPRAVSLLFSASQPFEDATYDVYQSELGAAKLFVHQTKRGRNGERTMYQVILN